MKGLPLNYFYVSGMYLFTIIALANSYTLFVNWDLLILSAKVSSIASIMFNVCLVGLFRYFYHQFQQTQGLVHVTKDDKLEQEDLEKYMKDLK